MIEINTQRCTGCGLCKRVCTAHSIDIVENKAKMFRKFCNACGHCVAVCPSAAISLTATDQSGRDVLPQKFIAADSFLHMAQSRRSIRLYKNAAVEKEKIEQLLEIGRYMPTGGNRQNVRYVVVTENISELISLVIDGLERYARKINDAKLIFAAKRYCEELNSNSSLTFAAPHALIILSKNDIGEGMIASAAIALMTYPLGLGACYSGHIQIGLANNPLAVGFLGMGQDEIVAACLVFGYPDITYQRAVERNSNKIQWL